MKRKKKEPVTAITVNEDSPRSPAEITADFMTSLMRRFIEMADRQTDMMTAMGKELDARRKYDAKQEKRRIELYELQEELLDKREDRDRERRKEKLKDDMVRGFIADAKPLVPLVMNRLAGKKVVEEPGSLELIRLFESLDEKQMQAMQLVLRPDQLAVFLAIVEVLIKQEKANAEASTRPSNSESRRQH